MVAKPPGLLVHRQPKGPREPAALQIVRDMVGNLVWPVHRLDRQVSGCLLFATERASAGPLHHALVSETSRKRYVALVRGRWRLAEEEVVVDTPMRDDNDILKDARSTVRVIATSAEPRCSLLLVEPHTGRYHQVRRHVRDLFHPVIGDVKHGDSHVNREWRARGMGRVALHCLSLRAGPVDVTCPLAPDMAAVLRALPWWEEAAEKLPELRLEHPPAPPPIRPSTPEDGRSSSGTSTTPPDP